MSILIVSLILFYRLMIALTLEDMSAFFLKESLWSEKKRIELEISYPSYFWNAKNIREFWDELFTRVWVSPKWRTRLVLVLDELNNNAIEYGSEEGGINTCRIFIEKWEGKISLCIEVIDTWLWTYHKTAQEMSLLKQEHITENFSEHESIRGRGLFLIIYRLVDHLYFEDSLQWGLLVGIKKELLPEDL